MCIRDRIKGEAFTTEREMPVFKKFAPSPAVKDMKHATIAVMTSGGLAPKGNPDRLEACNCTKYKKYSLEEDYGGKGVTKAVENINTIINETLTGLDASDIYAVDRAMIRADGTRAVSYTHLDVYKRQR